MKVKVLQRSNIFIGTRRTKNIHLNLAGCWMIGPDDSANSLSNSGTCNITLREKQMCQDKQCPLKMEAWWSIHGLDVIVKVIMVCHQGGETRNLECGSGYGMYIKIAQLAGGWKKRLIGCWHSADITNRNVSPVRGHRTCQKCPQMLKCFLVHNSVAKASSLWLSFIVLIFKLSHLWK